MSETRAAVHALRDEPVALAEQLAALAAADEAELSVTGTVRPLSADAGLALYRAAQQAVGNVRKHAPGAAISVCLNFDRAATMLIVTNGPCPRDGSANQLSQTGGGFRLRGRNRGPEPDDRSRRMTLPQPFWSSRLRRSRSLMGSDVSL